MTSPDEKSTKDSLKLKKPKVLFMGTPEFCLPTLKALKDSKKLNLELVVSQPDSKRGRKLELKSSPVKSFCTDNNIEVWTPDVVSSSESIQKIKAKSFDLIVVLAYGQILKQSLLDLMPDHFINIHASLLPKWRGAAPIQRAVMNGDLETGLSFQLMRLKLDTGPVIFEAKTKILKNEDSFELMNRLSVMSGEVVEEVLLKHYEQKLEPVLQEESLATYAKKIVKSEGQIDWLKPASEIHNTIRGLAWGPGAFTTFKSKRLKISKTEVIKDFKDIENLEGEYIENLEGLENLGADFNQVGCVCRIDKDAFYVSTKEGFLKVCSVQPEGKAKMTVLAFVNGYGLTLGDSFLKS
jgi:methionyl-tRNA formyltransferase